MTTLQRVLEYLDRIQVRYSHTTHSVAYTAREVAAAEHLPPHKLAKTVIYYADNGYGMAVVPADHWVALEELRIALEARHIRLATEAEVGALFPDCELGAMPPFGPMFHLPVWLDDGLESEESIAFNAGTHRDVIHMNLVDFKKTVNPKVARLAREAAFSR